ncbi:MAG: helix-turn-helix transcriptional regulator [Lachnospiraceae bacterium]|nr:helix-turn-helix transcriptional regulator [Lachnospiraceae bacterium]
MNNICSIDSNDNVLKLLRIARGYSVKSLADELNVSQSYIHAIEKGERQPSDKLYSEYLTVLGVDEKIVETFNKRAKKYNSYEKILLCLLKLICD